MNTFYRLMTVGLSDQVAETNYAAIIRGSQTVEIRSRISGSITEICIDEGSPVKKEQVLFIIDQAPYLSALEEARANVATAEAKLANARLLADGKKVLYRQKVVSEYDWRTAENSLQEATAVLAQAQAQKKHAENDLSYTIIKSPVDGVAGMIPYRVGALVGGSLQVPLVTVSGDEEMHAYFSVTENRMLELIRQYGSLDDALHQLPEVKLQLSNGAMYDYQGRIDAIGGTIDPETGSVSVRAVFPNPEKMLHHGSVGMVILSSTVPDCLVIPQEATYELQNQVFVYRVIDGRAISSPVEVRATGNGKDYMVKSGLREGDVIIAGGAGLVREGTEISTTVKSK